jgi:hypothetical protein
MIRRLYRLSVTIAKLTKRENTMGDLGIWGIIHLALVIYAAIQIFNSSADTGKKAIWVLIVAVFPLVGLIIWFFMGPGTPKK